MRENDLFYNDKSKSRGEEMLQEKLPQIVSYYNTDSINISYNAFACNKAPINNP